MSAQSELFELYEQWRTWTHAEREAIEASDWRRVSQCHGAKSDLRNRILKQTQLVQEESRGDQLNRAAMDRRVRAVVNELIYLESRNGEFLARRQRENRVEMDALNYSGRNLERIQKQYRPNAPSAWESYS